MVRIVDAVIDRLDISDILSTYRGGSNSAFNPKMILKVLVFAYLSNVYSSRRIEELLKRDIYFMWLSGMSIPGGSYFALSGQPYLCDSEISSALKCFLSVNSY